MSNIIFATGNDRKIKEAISVLIPLGINVDARKVEIDEIQHHDPAKITKAKAVAAYEAINKQVVVQDTSWSIPALGGFPGGYMKDVDRWWTPGDWIQLMKRHQDKTIYCHEHVAYFDGETFQHFESNYRGVFVDNPRGVWGHSIEKVVCLYGDKTLAEIHDLKGIAPAGEVLEHWQQFGEWFAAK